MEILRDNPELMDSLSGKLLVASLKGDLSYVTQLLEEGADPNISLPGIPSSKPLLTLLYEYPDLDLNLVRLFIMKGAKITSLDINIVLKSPNYLSIIRLLLDNEAIRMNDLIMTTLELYNVTRLKKILSELDDYKMNITDSIGNTTILMNVMERGRQRTCLEAVKLLLEYGADPNIQNYQGDTALIKACYHSPPSDVNMIKLLLNYGANPNIQNHKGENALIAACYYSDINAVKTLLSYSKKRINTNIQDNKGKTALMYAVERDYSSIVDLLLKDEYGTVTNIKDKRGRKAYDITYNNDIKRKLKTHEDRRVGIYADSIAELPGGPDIGRRIAEFLFGSKKKSVRKPRKSVRKNKSKKKSVKKSTKKNTKKKSIRKKSIRKKRVM